eukprot:457033-Amphidinium_carterae.2
MSSWVKNNRSGDIDSLDLQCVMGPSQAWTNTFHHPLVPGASRLDNFSDKIYTLVAVCAYPCMRTPLANVTTSDLMYTAGFSAQFSWTIGDTSTCMNVMHGTCELMCASASLTAACALSR